MQFRKGESILALANVYTQVYGQFPKFFNKIREGQAPQQFTQQLLKDLGFKSSNHRALIPLLKALGFLTPEGVPTNRYHNYRDYSQSKAVMGAALKEAYQDIFLIKSNPTKADRKTIEGKFKSYHNTSDRLAQLMTNTFLALLDLADLSGTEEVKHLKIDEKAPEVKIHTDGKTKPFIESPGLYYNIQIHLPATKDIEVYNAIFKSLKEHLFEK